MKRKLLSGMMAGLAALLATSCSSELAFEGAPDNGLPGEEMEVTFSIEAQALTRAEGINEDGTDEAPRFGGPGQWQNKIGKGLNIDMLIYAVYEKLDDGTYNLLEQYGKGIDINSENGFDATNLPAALADGAGEGQTILNVAKEFEHYKAKEITLRLMRGKEYYIAFWAQNSGTTAFNTADLTKVQVNYEGAKNNDELRDAFCKVESFSVTANAPTRTVILTRPMAQINVGTTGADYKHMILGQTVFNRQKVTQSKITLSGVAQYINVVTDEVDDSDLTNVEFAYDIIPAFMNTGLPNTDEDYYGGKNPKEEFLKVDLNQDGKVYGYKINYPTLDKNNKYLTETFKYLSMCYALVPAAAQPKPEEEKMPEYASSVLQKVEVTFAETKNGNTPGDGYTTISLDNVPVHRNWRTNILGGLKYMKDPTPKDPNPDPNDPEDPDPNDPGYPTPDPDPDDPDNPGPDPVIPPTDPDDPDTPEIEDPKDIPDGPEDDTTIFKFASVRVILDEWFRNEYTGKPGEDNKPDGKYEWTDPNQENNNQ